ncbi:hypothetical protein V6N12_048051 [Hibiscus sabdariffa]|uniref:Uncharacterized protein n=1 Tax=Hibiscus sabdariffa TaxID=183260 RepID=A0ABR2CUT5_9ROSI
MVLQQSAHVPLVDDTFPVTSPVQNSYPFPEDAQHNDQGRSNSNSTLHDQHAFSSDNRSQAVGDIQHTENEFQTHEPEPDLEDVSVQPVIEPPVYSKSSFLWDIDQMKRFLQQLSQLSLFKNLVNRLVLIVSYKTVAD